MENPLYLLSLVSLKTDEMGLSLCGSLCSLFSSGSFLYSFSSCSSLLVGYLLCNSLVDLLLLGQSLGSSVFLSLSLVSSDLLQTLLLVSLPCIKLLLSGSFVESALLHTTTQVLHQHHTLTAENVANGVSGLCAYLDPV